MWDFRRLRTDITGLALFAGTVFAAISMLSFDAGDPPARMMFPLRTDVVNWGGPVGAKLAFGMRSAFGVGAWLVVAALMAYVTRLLTRGADERPTQRTIGSLMVVVAACVALHLVAPGLASGQIVGSGGYVGAWGAILSERHFDATGTLLLIVSFFSAGLLLATELPFVVWAIKLAFFPVLLLNRIAFGRRVDAAVVEPIDRRGALSRRQTAKTKPAIVGADDEPQNADDAAATDPENEDFPAIAGVITPAAATVTETAPEPHEIRVNPPITAVAQRDDVMAQLEAASHQDDDSMPFTLPPLDMLEPAEDFPYELLAKKARVAALTLEKTFQEFGLNVRVVEIDTGPVITQFELELEAGLRLNKVAALADDLAVALRVPAVRVVAPIPGKNTVGVEVPNEKQVMVRMRELIESSPKELEDKRIPLFLGKDVSGRPLVIDMTKMPHLLIAGRTGTGKSVCLNTIILSMLLTRTPEQVKLLLIDPKMVELSPYKRVPHLMHPVITYMKKAEAVLAWAVDKMEERYDLLSRVGVRHLDNYNKLDHATRLERMGIDLASEEAALIPRRMPYIVIVADEMADLMMTSGKDVEGHIIRLAQKSRAVGIHLVLATQKPTVDVITGLIKSNLPARISFQVASRTDSRVVLDENGADKLLGNGDMLFLAPGTSHLTRAQGTYVSDEEVNSVIDYYREFEPEYNTELAQISATSGGKGGGSLKDRDELYEAAIDVVVREGRGSVSLLQRALGIGYGRAARLVDFMAEDGIVGDYNGAQAREVLYTAEQWEALRSNQPQEEMAD